jgi:PqqD family protein of HPr-rel-A system
VTPANPSALWAWAPGSRLTALGEGWVAYGGASGETLYLNDESAAVLELLRDDGPASFDAVCQALAADSGLDVAAITAAVQQGWAPLVEAGLIVAVDAGHG